MGTEENHSAVALAMSAYRADLIGIWIGRVEDAWHADNPYALLAAAQELVIQAQLAVDEAGS